MFVRIVTNCKKYNKVIVKSTIRLVYILSKAAAARRTRRQRRIRQTTDRQQHYSSARIYDGNDGNDSHKKPKKSDQAAQNRPPPLEKNSTFRSRPAPPNRYSTQNL
jgi:hypothetical protein